MSLTIIENNTEQLVNRLFDKQGYSADSVRSKNLQSFLEIGLPSKKTEEYKFTPFDTILEKVVDGADISPSELEKEEIQSFLYNESGHHLVYIDGKYNEELSQVAEDEAVSIAYSEELSGLNSVANEPDAFTALNTAFTSAYAKVVVKKGKEGLPVFVYHMVNATTKSFTNPRLIIQAEESSKIALVEKTWVDGEEEAFLNTVVEISVAKNASVNLSKLQNHARNVIIHDGLKVNQAKDSRFYVNTFTFSGKQIRNNLDVALNDQNCETHMHGLYLLNGSSHVDNHTSVDHKIANCHSNEVYKGIVDGKSHAVFNGKIFVRPDAQQTNAFQSNNNISLSDLATINTKPQLEIWADDVKCSHGCTIGQLDEEALFYLRARGLDMRSAKSMLLIAFAEDTFDFIPFEFFKEEIDQLIISRLS
ncbi:MAG: Fe-S cluster assembly protein SufD [Cyclobacteriaceae bacterium]